MDEAAPIEATIEDHVMGDALLSYVTSKVHQDLESEEIQRVSVVGQVQRNPPSRVANFERQRLFDCRRPTAYWKSPYEMQLNCFPSRNLVLHYASLLATYLKLHNRNPEMVQMRLPETPQISNLIFQSNLKCMGHADIAIIGDVDYLSSLCSAPWQGGSESEDGLFRWSKFESCSGKVVALVGCVEKIWGDAGGHLIRALRALSGVGCVIYVAKAGSLAKEYSANEMIATGEHAFLGEESIFWESPLETALSASTKVARGSIVTVSTLLCETQQWLHHWNPKVQWVDCEVAYMAKSAVEEGIHFGYLHIISDNLHCMGGEDLSNEESDKVLAKRKILYEDITRIIYCLCNE